MTGALASLRLPLPLPAAISWFSLRDGVLVAALAALAAVVGIPPLLQLVRRWSDDPDYGHGFLVPLVSVYLIQLVVERRAPGWVTPRPAWILGSALGMFGGLLMAFEALLPSEVLAGSALIAILMAIAAFCLGGSQFRHFAAPLAFLLFMVPLPAVIYASLAFPLQLLVSQAASVLLTIIGVPVFCEGNLLHLPERTLHVAQACSGLRQLTAFVALGTCAALLMPRSNTYRFLVVAATVPIALLMNLLRVTADALIGYAGWHSLNHGVGHTVVGLLMVAGGAGLTYGFCNLLDWIMPSSTSPTPRPFLLGVSRAGAVAAVLLLLATFAGRAAATHYVDTLRTQAVQLQRPIEQFPRTLAGWVGTDVPADPQVIRDIRIDAYVKRLYKHASGQEALVWLSYSRTSADQYHYPTVCMRGKGWHEYEAERQLVALHDDVDCLRLHFVKDTQKQSIHYWSYLMGEAPSDRLMRSLSRSARAFLRGRTNTSMTVEVHSQSAQPDVAMLDDLARLVHAELGAFLPADTVVSPTLGARQ